MNRKTERLSKTVFIRTYKMAQDAINELRDRNRELVYVNAQTIYEEIARVTGNGMEKRYSDGIEEYNRLKDKKNNGENIGSVTSEVVNALFPFVSAGAIKALYNMNIIEYIRFIRKYKLSFEDKFTSIYVEEMKSAIEYIAENGITAKKDLEVLK